MRQLDTDVYFPVVAGARPFVLLTPTKRHAIALDVVASGRQRRFNAIADMAAGSLSALVPGATWEGPAGPISVPAGTELLRFVVCDSPGRCAVVSSSPGPPVVSVSDLSEIAARAQDAIELWEFLAEVASPPRIKQLVAPGLSELWDLWREAGTLNPGDVEVDEARVGWSTDLGRWQEAAAWDQINGVLTRAALPATSYTSRRRLDAPNDAQIWWLRDPKRVLLVRANPDLVVDLPLDDLGPLDLELVVNFANTLLLAADQLEAFRQALVSCRPGLRIVVDANNAGPPQVDKGADDGTWIGLWTARQPRPTIGLAFDHSLMALNVFDPGAAREMLGGALGAGLGRLGIRREMAGAVAEAWSAWQMPLRVELVEGGPKRPFHVPRGLEPYHEARALRELFARLRASDLAPGTYEGSLAVQVCDRFVSQELSSMLADHVARYDRTSLLALAANEVGAVLGERRRSTMSLKASLNAPWGDDRRAAAAFGEDTAVFLTKASQLVLEAALSEPRGGTVAPDRADWAHLLAIADAMLQVAQRRALARFDIQPVNVKVDGEGHVSITQTEALTLDIANFDAFRRLMALRPGAETALTTNVKATMGFAEVVRAMGSPGSRGEAPFESFVDNEDVPSGFREIDRAMREQLASIIHP